MFDKVVTKNGIEYGSIHGNNTLFFIKVGNGGSIYGDEDKYLRISQKIHSDYGCSVLVSGNPVEMHIKDAIVLDFEFIKENFPYIAEVNAFGHSNGGQMLVSYAYMYPIIKNVLAVNVPLMINLHKTKEGIEKFTGNKIHMIYGEKDPSFRYIKILDSKLSLKFGYSTVENANHMFENMVDEFISLPERFLF
ncbi:MAG: alpha/beta hydrolase [Clostridia bacterium]|nr:alpha/beta hydrolase [Clostridia bacterium]